MRSPFLATALLFASSLLACSLAGDDTASQEAAHTEGQPTYAQYKWLWASDTEDEFKKNAAASSYWDTPQFLALEHPMAQRLQFWLDQMDAALRAKVPDAMKNTPRPRIILRKDESPNAWVTFMPVTFDVKTRLTRSAGAKPEVEPPTAPVDAGDADADQDAGAPVDAGPPPPPPSSPAFMLRNTGEIKLLGEATPFERPHDERTLEEFLEFHNHGFSKCKLSMQDTEIVFGDGCAIAPEVTTDRSDKIAYYATSTWITVTTGLITSMLDEDRIVAVLAHELGHYYRTHSAQPSDELNYFYALGDANVPMKPSPDPKFLDMTLKAREKLRGAGGWSWPDFTEENKLMVERRLGFYTTEQEADEIALELLTKVGMPATLGPDSMLQLHKIIDDMGGGGTGDIKWEQCSLLRDRGWKDESGAPMSIPVGDLSDAHHSFCFRVFNMTREITAHAYKITEARKKPEGESWAKLVQKLSNEVEPPPPPPPPPPADADAGPAPSDAGTD